MKKISVGITIIGLVIVSAVFINRSFEKPEEKAVEQNEHTSSSEKKKQFSYNILEVSKHNTKNDCWIIINSKVYDITTYMTSHPGGAAILQGCGRDATQLFETRPMGSGTPHSEDARDIIEAFFIGFLKK